MISGSFGTLAFVNPWVLFGLSFLPVLWFLLKVTPPAPRLIIFPAARFMEGLDARKQVPNKTPWWILLLRILAAALIILALARPILNPGDAIDGGGPVRIVMDNSWSSAQTWRIQTAQANDIIERAARERRSLYIVTTAPEPGKTEPQMQGPLTRGEADAYMRGLKPLPWPADYDAAARVLGTAPEQAGIQSYWLSNGLMEGDHTALVRTLQAQGALTFFAPAANQLPVLLRPDKSKPGQFGLLVEFVPGVGGGVPLSLQALARDGRLIDSVSLSSEKDRVQTRVKFELPASLQNQVSRFQIAGRQGAGSLLLVDNSAQRHTVGISTSTGNADKAPLTEARHYIRRAIEPYADITEGPTQELLDKNVSVIILPDVGAVPVEELETLEGWVREGGLLLRFGGPNMTQGDNFLTPVAIRSGGRAMQGSLTWEKPAKLAPFPMQSPYYGLEVPEDLTIARQLLAEPEADLEKKSWAMLEDGTPLITADNLDDGLIVLIHTTATPEWSNLVLSGLFVKVMERTLQMTGNKAAMESNITSTMQPISVVDGMGRITQPGPTVQPIPAGEFEAKIPDSAHPPGIYGRVGVQRALNLGERLGSIRPFSELPGSVTQQNYGGINEQNLMPFILCLALILFLIDWIAMIILQAGWRILSHPSRWAQAAIILAVLIMPVTSAHAESAEERIRYASEIHLAYIHTGIADVDNLAAQGLEGLRQVLRQRTSVEAAGVIGVNPETDDLSFFPLIYWAITPGQTNFSGKAMQKIQYYLDHGGTILIDTRDQSTTPRGFGETAGGSNSPHLRRLMGGLNVPPLMVIPKDHVLTKSFYLLDHFPGRYDGKTIWVEENSASGRDGVSSVIIGGNDWISSWASPAQSRQSELALRFGVNVMMYALTGNYKADQVHIPHILERLGQ